MKKSILPQFPISIGQRSLTIYLVIPNAEYRGTRSSNSIVLLRNTTKEASTNTKKPIVGLSI